MKGGRAGALQPPGSGILPWHERRAAALYLRGQAALTTPAATLRRFRREAGMALAVADGLSEARGRQPVSIRRFPGLEPGFRDWSVYMVLDHLIVVNTGITAIVHALCTDHAYGIELLDEDVRPRADAGPDRIGALDAAVERYGDLIERLGRLDARERHPHPWFGPLTARQWHVLAMLHNRVHRIQIERIARRLG